MNLSVREAREEDAELFWNWANDAEVRKNAFSGRPIPWGEHILWFKEKVASPETLMLLFSLGEDPVGQVRFDRDGEEAYIDVLVCASHRSRGMGRRILTEAVERMKRVWPACVAVALVKEGNEASLRVFASCGFSRVPGGRQGVVRFERRE